LINKGYRRISPFFVPGSIINMISGHMSIMYGLKGPNIAMVTACTNGTHSIGEAARIIEYGDADVMIAGGAESTVSPLGIGGFAAMRALSTRNDDPTAASRPWDKDRDGFVLGEGAGVLVLEEYEHAKKRGAKIYGEVVGYGMSADASHMTAPCADGDGAARCMKAALRNAGMNPDAVDYVNAHGTSTPLGDVAETMAVKRALGDHAYKTVVNSTKSMTGHLLGAAGGIEAVFTALAVHYQVSPPSLPGFSRFVATLKRLPLNSLRNAIRAGMLSSTPGFFCSVPRHRVLNIIWFHFIAPGFCLLVCFCFQSNRL